MTSQKWTLAWHDEFDGPAIDRTRWHVEDRYTGESNAEMEIYTDRPENIRLQNGILVIEARQETYAGFHHTSGRLTTKCLCSWTYGRFEARIKIPLGQGLWPAFWLLGDNISHRGWPACGEIDIMENIGRTPAAARGTIHGPGYSGDDGIWSDYILAEGRFADDFHIFAIEWEPGQIRWYVDGNLFSTRRPQDVGGEWVFEHPFFIILNMAVGGYWPGYPDETTVFPQRLLVDYVRVFQR